LSESFFAEEDDGRLKDEAHGVQFKTFLDFSQEVRDIEPLHASIVQQVTRTQVDGL
jgi:hypothetical protein